MDAKEFMLKALQICKDHDCIDCPLENRSTKDPECRLDHFNCLYSGDMKKAVDQLVTIVEHLKEDKK